MDNYIEIRGVTKRFKDKLVLDDISLVVPKGKIFGIIGQNGSGKTTLLNMLIGFLKPNKGNILFQGIDTFKDMKDIEIHFGFATQEDAFYYHLTVEENLYYFGRLYNINKKEIKDRIKKILDLLKLESSLHVLGSHLSVGMRRRLDIACALIHKPSVLILDEPTEDLDPLLRKELLSLIKRINEQGTTVIITSHHLEELESICDEVVILNKTKIVKIGTPEELEMGYSKNMILTLELSSGKYSDFVKKLKSKVRIVDVNYENNQALLETPDGLKLLSAALKLAKERKEVVVYISLDRPSLDVIFENIVRS